MQLSEKYDKFYQADPVKEAIPSVPVRRWPCNRMEAIVKIGGHGDSILDIGCGNGNLLYQFRNSFKKLIGLEYSNERLEQTKRNLAEYDFVPVLGQAENMSAIESYSIDQVVSADTIEHVVDVYAATKEIHRILKPGGLLVINTPNIAFLKKRMLLCFGRFPATSQPNEGIGDDLLFDGGHLHYFTYRSLRIILERSGFQMVSKMGYGKFGILHTFWPSLASPGVQWVAQKPR